jgi:hypothetical protein
MTEDGFVLDGKSTSEIIAFVNDSTNLSEILFKVLDRVEELQCQIDDIIHHIADPDGIRRGEEWQTRALTAKTFKEREMMRLNLVVELIRQKMIERNPSKEVDYAQAFIAAAKRQLSPPEYDRIHKTALKTRTDNKDTRRKDFGRSAGQKKEYGDRRGIVARSFRPSFLGA